MSTSRRSQKANNGRRRQGSYPCTYRHDGTISGEQHRVSAMEDSDRNRKNTKSIEKEEASLKSEKDSINDPSRIVYDCSWRQSRNDQSLKDCLQSTPRILNELTAILTRFRMHQFAVTTDIEKAFLHLTLPQLKLMVVVAAEMGILEVALRLNIQNLKTVLATRAASGYYRQKTDERTNERTNGRRDERTDGRKKRQRTDARMNEGNMNSTAHTNVRLQNKQPKASLIVFKTNELTDGRTN
ncbi:hypothetical protein DPMN_029766 [Dreissena polymorpha]|uniref:Reverse transcriptase domain-containing protein n=1 Tax=Dreissena polymorpha TaxID=45954 RepID=A0A9D4RGI9_DREPO|nr:hypothetical protein DPMN_029766 [Dreissena polymorpha]